MKRCSLILFTGFMALQTTSPSWADDMNMDMSGGMDHMTSGSEQPMEAAKGVKGVIRQIDRTKGIVTISHEPIPSLGWSAMTMDFSVKNPAWLGSFKAGQSVHFDFVRQRGAYVITAVK